MFLPLNEIKDGVLLGVPRGCTSTNVGRTNVGRHKRRTVQTSDAQTSDQYKRRTSTNVGRVHL